MSTLDIQIIFIVAKAIVMAIIWLGFATMAYEAWLMVKRVYKQDVSRQTQYKLHSFFCRFFGMDD